MTEQAVILPSFVRSTNKSKTEFSEFQQAFGPRLHPGDGRQVLCRRVHGAADGSVPEPRCPRAAPQLGRLAPHLIYSPSDSLDSDPPHEGTHSWGEISLSALLANLVFGQTLLFLNLLQTAKSNLSGSSIKS